MIDPRDVSNVMPWQNYTSKKGHVVESLPMDFLLKISAKVKLCAQCASCKLELCHILTASCQKVENIPNLKKDTKKYLRVIDSNDTNFNSQSRASNSFLYFDESTTSAAAQQQLNKQMRSSFQTKAIFYQQANLSTELF